MLAYGDADLVLAMNAETATNSANADADAIINAAHTAINADITAHIVIDSDTAIDINTVININAASDIDIAISAAATTVRGQAPSSPSHASHI